MSFSHVKSKAPVEEDNNLSGFDCFSKVKLWSDLKQEDINRTIQVYKHNTFKIGSLIASMNNNDTLKVGKKRMKFLFNIKRRMGTTKISLGNLSMFKGRLNELAKGKTLTREAKEKLGIEKKPENVSNYDKLNKSLTFAVQPKKSTPQSFPSVHDRNIRYFSELMKTRSKELESKKEELEFCDLFLKHKNTDLNSKPPQINLIQEQTDNHNNDSPHLDTEQDTKRLLKPALRKLKNRRISFSFNKDNTYGSQMNNSLSSIHNTETNTIIVPEGSKPSSLKASILKRSNIELPVNVIPDKTLKRQSFIIPLATEGSEATTPLNAKKKLTKSFFTINKLLDKDVISENPVVPRNKRSRFSQDGLGRSILSNTINSHTNQPKELKKIKQEEVYIKTDNDILNEDLIKLKQKIEYDPFKKDFLNDLKSLDKIKIDRTIYIFGDNMVKPKIMKESENNIFQESEKISKLSSSAAYYSKEMLLKKFKIDQNNKNPNVMNFKVKLTRDKVNELMSEVKSNDRFNAIQGMITKMKKREKQFLAIHSGAN